MSTQVEIKNGSGWNNYKALRELHSLPRGWNNLAKQRGIAVIRIEPTSNKPFGFAAKFIGEPTEDDDAPIL